MQRETTASITRWGDSAFGPVSELARLIDRAEGELAELREAVQLAEGPDALAMEAADVVILLHRLVGLTGLDLDQAVQDKMAINRARRWTPEGDGTGQHVENE